MQEGEGDASYNNSSGGLSLYRTVMNAYYLLFFILIMVKKFLIT